MKTSTRSLWSLWSSDSLLAVLGLTVRGAALRTGRGRRAVAS